MTRDELREKLWQELDRQDQVGCLHMGERVAAIMAIVVGERIEVDWDKVPDGDDVVPLTLDITKMVPVTLVEKVCDE
jgi:hypothetical protein